MVWMGFLSLSTKDLNEHKQWSMQEYQFKRLTLPRLEENRKRALGRNNKAILKTNKLKSSSFICSWLYLCIEMITLCKYGKLFSSTYTLHLKSTVRIPFLLLLRLWSLLDVSIHKWNNPLNPQQSFTLPVWRKYSPFLRSRLISGRGLDGTGPRKGSKR